MIEENEEKDTNIEEEALPYSEWRLTMDGNTVSITCNCPNPEIASLVLQLFANQIEIWTNPPPLLRLWGWWCRLWSR